MALLRPWLVLTAFMLLATPAFGQDYTFPDVSIWQNSFGATCYDTCWHMDSTPPNPNSGFDPGNPPTYVCTPSPALRPQTPGTRMYTYVHVPDHVFGRVYELNVSYLSSGVPPHPNGFFDHTFTGSTSYVREFVNTVSGSVSCPQSRVLGLAGVEADNRVYLNLVPSGNVFIVGAWLNWRCNADSACANPGEICLGYGQPGADSHGCGMPPACAAPTVTNAVLNPSGAIGTAPSGWGGGGGCLVTTQSGAGPETRNGLSVRNVPCATGAGTCNAGGFVVNSGGCASSGTMTQTISGLTRGATYTVAFHARATDLHQYVTAYFDGVPIGHAFATNAWRRLRFAFHAPTTSGVLSFQLGSTATTPAALVLVDNVDIQCGEPCSVSADCDDGVAGSSDVCGVELCSHSSEYCGASNDGDMCTVAVTDMTNNCRTESAGCADCASNAACDDGNSCTTDVCQSATNLLANSSMTGGSLTGAPTSWTVGTSGGAGTRTAGAALGFGISDTVAVASPGGGNFAYAKNCSSTSTTNCGMNFLRQTVSGLTVGTAYRLRFSYYVTSSAADYWLRASISGAHPATRDWRSASAGGTGGAWVSATHEFVATSATATIHFLAKTGSSGSTVAVDTVTLTTANACTHTAIAGCCNNTVSCTADGNVCTNDVCSSATAAAGTCSYPAIMGCMSCAACTPTNACFTATCNAGTGFTCVQSYIGDGATCSGTGVCRSSPTQDCYTPACWPPGSASCPTDGNSCTSDLCSSLGECLYSAVLPNSVCSGGCCDGTMCRASQCAVATAAADCNDSNPCTIESCSLSCASGGVCGHSPAPNGTVCPTGVCTAGVCGPAPCTIATQATDCNDGNPCTADLCQSAACINTPVASSPVPGAPNCALGGSGPIDGFCSGAVAPVCTECLTASHCPVGLCCGVVDPFTGETACGACSSCIDTTSSGGTCDFSSPGPLGTDGDSIFRILAQGDTSYDPIGVTYSANTADIYFLADSTASMSGELGQFTSNISANSFPSSCAASCTNPGIIGAIRCCFTDSWFGVGSVDDFAVAPYGSAATARTYYTGNPSTGDRALWNRIGLTSPLLSSGSQNLFGPAAQTIVGNGLQRVIEAANSIIIGNGGTVADAQLPALSMLATGSSPWAPQSAIAASAWVTPQYGRLTAPGVYCDSDNYFGYPCFRNSATPIVVLMSDSPFHNGPALDSLDPLGSVYPVLSNAGLYASNITYGSLGGGVSAPPSFSSTVQSLLSRQMRTVIVESSDGRVCASDADCVSAPPGCSAASVNFEARCVNSICRGPGYAHAIALANASGSVTSVGAPLVSSVSCAGTGLPAAVVANVASLAGGERMDVSAVAVGAPSGIQVIATPIAATPVLGCDPPTSGVFPRCAPGTDVNFAFRIRNVGIAPVAVEQVFNFRVEIRAGINRVIRAIPVRVVVPSTSAGFLASGQYSHNYDTTSTCLVNERPEWGRFQWTADLPAGTQIAFEFRSADSAAGVAGATAVPVGTITSSSDIDGNGLADIVGEIVLSDAISAGGGLLYQRYGRLTAVLRANAGLSQSPTLENFDLQYTCVPRE